VRRANTRDEGGWRWVDCVCVKVCVAPWCSQVRGCNHACMCMRPHWPVRARVEKEKPMGRKVVRKKEKACMDIYWYVGVQRRNRPRTDTQYRAMDQRRRRQPKIGCALMTVWQGSREKGEEGGTGGGEGTKDGRGRKKKEKEGMLVKVGWFLPCKPQAKRVLSMSLQACSSNCARETEKRGEYILVRRANGGAGAHKFDAKNMHQCELDMAPVAGNALVGRGLKGEG
jgi:hypothetical protein